jgi:hypothetical protein
MTPADWTLTIETFAGLDADVSALERFADALEADEEARGPAASLDSARGVLGATFDVRADTQGRALDRGVAIFYAALGAAGYDVAQPGWTLRLEIAPSADEPEAVPA